MTSPDNDCLTIKLRGERLGYSEKFNVVSAGSGESSGDLATVITWCLPDEKVAVDVSVRALVVDVLVL
jgi:hypothetical protein